MLRAVRRAAPKSLPRARQVLADLNLIHVSDDLLDAAAEVGPPDLRSLDAVHLAAAASLGEELRGLLSYDRRMLDAAEGMALPTLTPGL